MIMRDPTVVALNEMRLSIVDEMFRRGATPATIAVHLLSDPQCVEHGLDLGLSTRTDISHPEKIRELSTTVRRDLGTLKSRTTLPSTASARQEALEEYVRREDEIFRQAWRDGATAFSVRDRVMALKLAQQSARNKARAIGVPLEVDFGPESGDTDGFGRLPAGTVVIQNLGQVAVLNGDVRRSLTRAAYNDDDSEDNNNGNGRRLSIAPHN